MNDPQKLDYAIPDRNSKRPIVRRNISEMAGFVFYALAFLLIVTAAVLCSADASPLPYWSYLILGFVASFLCWRAIVEIRQHRRKK
jgi:ABC-type nickel/cobalt efflux system permease component RcnA